MFAPGKVPWGPQASPLGDGVAKAGADAGAAIQKSTMKPGGIAEQGFSGTAQPLPFRDEMEQSFGADFSGVKVFADGNAKQANQKLGASAYVVDDKIAFNTSAPDRATVAHELTHVLQHTGRGGARPSNGETDARGIDMAGEPEAERVEAAIASGQRAKSALDGAAPGGGASKRKGPARKAQGDSAFGYGLTFSPDSFKTGFSYTLWSGTDIEVPTMVPPVLAFLSPSVTIACDTGVNWDAAEESDTGLVVSVGVTGSITVGLSAGSQAVAAVYSGITGSVTGGFTYTLNKDAWSLDGSLSLASNLTAGVKVAGGIIDYSFEFGWCDPICTFTGIRWDNNGFTAGTFDFGPTPKSVFAMIAEAASQGQQIVDAGIVLATDGVEYTAQTITNAAEWSGNAFESAVGGVGAVFDKAEDIVDGALGKIGL